MSTARDMLLEIIKAAWDAGRSDWPTGPIANGTSGAALIALADSATTARAATEASEADRDMERRRWEGAAEDARTWNLRATEAEAERDRLLAERNAMLSKESAALIAAQAERDRLASRLEAALRAIDHIDRDSIRVLEAQVAARIAAQAERARLRTALDQILRINNGPEAMLGSSPACASARVESAAIARAALAGEAPR